ncbi:WD40 repeat-like protein [Xylariaceae sp. FL1272]|nr:WD40 repeat-like protein [Xylariaceae sp. FL1272]
MAAPPSSVPSSRNNVIDLTSDTEPEDDDAAGGRKSATLHPAIRRSPLRPPSSNPPSISSRHHGHHKHHGDATLPSRPMKRQRTETTSPHIRNEVTSNVTEALTRCLKDQVFPHLERATKSLAEGAYDLDKMGAKATRLLVDNEFVRNFHKGGGRLDAALESIVASRCHRIVIELSTKPEYQLSPNSPAPNTLPGHHANGAVHAPAIMPSRPSIIPSIETEQGVQEQIKDEDSSADVKRDVSSDYQGEEYDDADGEDDYKNEEEGAAGIQSVDPQHAHSIRPSRLPPTRLAHELLPTNPSKKMKITSPQKLRAKAKAKQWQSGKSFQSSPLASSTPLASLKTLPFRPYVSGQVRQQIIQGGAHSNLSPALIDLPRAQNFHVDFSTAEIGFLQTLARKLYGRPSIDGARSTLRDLRNVMKKVPDMKSRLIGIHRTGYDGFDPPPLSLSKRSSADLKSFLDDLYSKKLNSTPVSLSIEQCNPVSRSETTRANRIPSLLLSREISGNRLGATRTYVNLKTAARSNLEDYLEPQLEWTNCAGDIMTVSWVSSSEFICGATTHSDSHNQQYNKPGNLLLGSARSQSLQAYPDHRIVRPLVSTGDNALESMVASQDPWLFTSVVSSDYDPVRDLAYTSSFDKTVKVWKPAGSSMSAIGTWEHGGRVNFVLASKNPDVGVVATAADVPTEAVRVYTVQERDVLNSPYASYSCTRVLDEDYVPSDKWAYYPAAIRWGLADNVRHLLLIGYSPRSPTNEDHEIPEDKMDTGELCLWDTNTNSMVKVNSAKTQNVFEVAWHPTRASFAAATSASQVLEKTDRSARTQIRIFESNKDVTEWCFSAIKTLDCAAIDINELSIMPNSFMFSYVAAGCTDGKVYVWDTSASDLPMCTLKHGDPVEELLGERETEDVGVKFTAWATTADRLYTGSSDGVLKVWNIRHGKGELVKELLEVAAPITCGAFSQDYSKLVIGDGSGRVYLLALEDPEIEEKPASLSAGFLSVHQNGKRRSIRRPRPFTPHPELPPPDADQTRRFPDLMEGQARAREFLGAREIEIHPNPVIGAVQGPFYTYRGPHRLEAHVVQNKDMPLLPVFEQMQQRNLARRPPPLVPRQERHERSLLRWPSHDLDSYDYFTFNEQSDLLPGAELDDSLVEFDYETSIPDSDEEDKDDSNREDSNDDNEESNREYSEGDDKDENIDGVIEWGLSVDTRPADLQQNQWQWPQLPQLF